MHQNTTAFSEADIEKILQAKGLNAPRLSPKEVDDNIIHSEFVRHVSLSGQVLRWCVLTTKNGYAVTGDPSVAVSPENDDREVGEKVAFANAKLKLWPLMGYVLKERLAAKR